MRDKMLGRWMVRLAVTMGTGAVALGLSGTTAQADIVSGSGLSAVPGAVTVVGVPAAPRPAPTEGMAVIMDWGWT
ncbi:hypothetical protein KZZ52_56560 [Dactylosporangium sp. AC04546]|uniref:hypothetical protein n=1 Tax=unclassified Dactylosporangium TaxID=2621675 RepID=UPI001EDF7EA7|nr:hypothetical protein [Dactylosporangium sp. AC04546]WVK83227.1 hypothetical protein KZZ52_56560 [Dactylosporangium sp. AC04546]